MKIPWYRQHKMEKRTLSISEIFQIIYHSSLLGGVILSILYFVFSVGAFPSIGNISELASYIITIFGVAFFFVTYFSITIIAPAFTLSDTNLPTQKYKNLIWHFCIISLIIVCVLNLVIYYDSLAYMYWLLTIFIVLPLLQLLLNKYFSAEWKDIIRISIWGSFSIYILLSILFLALIISTNSHGKEDFEDVFMASIFLQAMFLIPNTIIIYNINLLNSSMKNLKQIIKLIIFVMIIIIGIISIVFSIFHKPNPIVIAPFSLLKLGHYTAELHFKNDFTKMYPFPTDSNSTSNTFFVLSSIGDEYIISATPRYIINKVDENKTFKIGNIISKNDNKMYWYNDQNYSTIWKDANLITEVNSTISKNLQDEINKTQFNPYRIYRIKKENIEFEVVGKEIEMQSTIWERNAKK